MTCAKNAWVTYVNNGTYLSASLTLFLSLQRVDTEYPFVIMVPLDDDTFNIDNHMRVVPKNIVIHKVPKLDRQEPNHSYIHYASVLNKLHIWNLTDYDKVCWLDSDMIVKRNIDHLFDIHLGTNIIAGASGCLCNVYKNKKFLTAPERCPFNDPINHVYLNAGLMLTVPSTSMFSFLIEQDYNHPMPEQDVFSDVFKSRILTLPSTYNYLNHLDLIHQHIDYSNVHVFHFGYDKPWDNQGRPIYKAYYDYWYELHNEVKEKLLQPWTNKPTNPQSSSSS